MLSYAALLLLLIVPFSMAFAQHRQPYRGLCRPSVPSTPPFPFSQLPWVRMTWPSTLQTDSDRVEVDVQNLPPSLLPNAKICFTFWYEDAPFEPIRNVGCDALLENTLFYHSWARPLEEMPDPLSTPSKLFSSHLPFALKYPRAGTVTLAVSLELFGIHDMTTRATFIAELNALFESGVEQSASCLAPSSSSLSSSSSSSLCVTCPLLPPIFSITTFSYAPTSDAVASDESFPSGPSYSSHPLVQSVRSSYDRGVQGLSSLPPSVLQIQGMSGSSYRHFINSLLSSLPGSPTYLEIGVWGGSSFVSALYGNPSVSRATAIDNWSEFGGPKNIALDYIRAFVPSETEVLVIERDCWSLSAADILALGPVDVYFFDGPHTQLDHYRALTDYFPALAETSVVLIDDWNFVDVRAGSEAAMKVLPVDVLYERTITTTRSSHTTPDSLWHNGLKMMVLKKKTVSDSTTE